MAGVRDPAFWKRFSMAVHLDEENGQQNGTELKHSDSWLARQNRKKSRRTIVCWVFWICFLAFVAGVVAVIIWGVRSGIFEGGSSNDNSKGSQRRDLNVRRTEGVFSGPITQLVDLRDGKFAVT